MASILKVGKRWRALIRRKGQRSYCKTFDTEAEARAWAKRVEDGVPDEGSPMLLADLIDHYRRLRIELGRPILATSNTEYMLQHLADDLGGEQVERLTPQVLAKWARMRKEQGAGPYTVNMELSQLGTLIRHTASFLGITLPDVVGAARPLLHYGQLIGGGGRRTRRPTEDELHSLLAWLDERNPVVADAVRVAAITGLRRGELVRIRFADIDHAKRAVLVRQRKHPRRMEAKDEFVPLLGDAWDIVHRQPKGERIFAVSPETLTDSVTEGTRALGIPDLRLHDMRREATSRLRELGFDEDARMAVTGHRSKEIHSRYVRVDLQELHERYAAGQGSEPRPPRQPADSARPSASKRTPPEGDDS